MHFITVSCTKVSDSVLQGLTVVLKTSEEPDLRKADATLAAVKLATCGGSVGWNAAVTVRSVTPRVSWSSIAISSGKASWIGLLLVQGHLDFAAKTDQQAIT